MVGEPVNAASAGQALELVLARVFEADVGPSSKLAAGPETSTSPGCASDAIRVTAWTATPRTLPAWRSTARVDAPGSAGPRLPRDPDRASALNGTRRPVEEGQETVARRRHLQPRKAVELTPHAIAMAGEKLLPRGVAEPHGHVRRADDVRDEKRGDDALSRLWRFRPAAHACELDADVGLVAHDSRQVTRRNVERLARAHDAARTVIHLDLDLARQDDALVVVQAG